MKIFNLDELKAFESNLKEHLSSDKIYLPISKKLVVLLREIKPYLLKLDNQMNAMDQFYVSQTLNINKLYAEHLDNFHRSLKVIMDKNHLEIEKGYKTKNQKTHELHANFKVLLEQLELKATEENQQADQWIKEAETIYKREIASFNRTIQEAKKEYQETSFSIEAEKELSITQAKTTYDDKLITIQNQLETFKQTQEEKLVEIKESLQSMTIENDNIYLNIKNTYSQTSIQLNKKINELKKIYNQALAKITKEHQARMEPIQKAINDLTIAYQEMQGKAKTTYAEKLNSLNVIFDVQKQTYEAKKQKIIHDANEAITLLNSKLTAFRETIAKDKLQTTRTMRDEMKSLEDQHSKDKLNRQLRSQMNQYDQDLNKQIIRTNKDILEKHREQQRRLFNLDIIHLREINEWRLKKALFEYEKKQEFAKLELNFNHNMHSSELTQNNLESTYLSYKEILLNQHNKDLLSLEYQLMISAALQERELNLLANDAHLLLAESKLKEQLIAYDIKLQESLNELEKEKAKALYHADTQVLNITVQLELEKAKAKRDYEMAEQELRIELSQLMFSKAKDNVNHKLDASLKQIDLERELLYIENKAQLDSLKYEAHLEAEKRTHIVNEAKYKHQQRLSDEKASRFLKLSKSELEHNQEQTILLQNAMLLFYRVVIELKSRLLELYHLPSHPETLKLILREYIPLIEALKTLMLDTLNTYQENDLLYYQQKIDDQTGYRYMLKHENMIDFYHQDIQKLEEQRKDAENDLRKLEEQLLNEQTLLERNFQFIHQLTKISHDIKSNELKVSHKHHDLKENQKLISNHELEIKQIKAQLTKIEKAIKLKHKEIQPLDDQLDKLMLKEQEAEKQLIQLKHKEASIFYRYSHKNQMIYESYKQSVLDICQTYTTFYATLRDEVYLSDNFILNLLKRLRNDEDRFEKQLIDHPSKLFNLMLDFYLQGERKQQSVSRAFKNSTDGLILRLNKSYESHLHSLDQEDKKRLKDKEHQIQIEKLKAKKQQELSDVTYQKKLALDQLTVKDIESKISSNGSKAQNEQKLLNENQQSIATQYAHEYETTYKALEDQYLKNTHQTKQQMDALYKNLDTTAHQLEIKNNSIIQKYEQTHTKHLESLQSRQKNYQELMSKSNQIQQQKNKSLEALLKRMSQKREDDFRNILNHTKRYQVTTRIEQNKVMNREIRILKKSHRFRMRMLKLN